jgi:uncharacterized protein (DUF4415 family)
MNAKSPSIAPGWTDPDDAPDLSAPDWAAHIAAQGVVTRGRPKSDAPKVSVTLRVDRDVVGRFRAQGPGWQTRMNEALRKAAGLP